MHRRALAALALFACVATPSQAVYVNGIAPLPPNKPARNACDSAFYVIARDPQLDGVVPQLDVVALGLAESPRGLSFGFYVTDNTTLLPQLSIYEVRFSADDTLDEYFVRFQSSHLSQNGAPLPLYQYQYGLRRKTSDGYRDVVVKDFTDNSNFFFASGAPFGPGLVSFGISKKQLEDLSPQARGFDLGATLRRISAHTALADNADRPIGDVDTLISHGTTWLDETLRTNYRVRTAQTCP